MRPDTDVAGARRRAWPRPAAALVALAVTAGCSGDDAQPADPVAPSSTVEVVVPAPPTTMRMILPAPTSPPTITVPQTVPPKLIEDCVEVVRFGAFTGNPMLVELWDAAGASVARLRIECRHIGESNPAGLQALSDLWASIEGALPSTNP